MENRELCLGYGSAIELWRQARRRVAAQNPADLLVRLLFDRNPHVRLDALPAAVFLPPFIIPAAAPGCKPHTRI